MKQEIYADALQMNSEETIEDKIRKLMSFNVDESPTLNDESNKSEE